MALPPPKNAAREIPRFPGMLWDILRAGRGRPEDTVLRQRVRLHRLIEYARSRSPFYRERYAALPRRVRELPELPPVSKSELMADFDGWATDPAVSRKTAEAFIADPARIGRLYLDRYVAFSTSGTTGTPAVILQDSGAMSVYQALLLARRLPTLIAAGAFRPFLRNRARTATIITTGGHFASSVVEALVRMRHPGLADRNRTFSLRTPLPELVRALNEFRPAIVGSYPTVLAVLAGEQAAGRLRIAPALLLSGAERDLPERALPGVIQDVAAFLVPGVELVLVHPEGAVVLAPELAVSRAVRVRDVVVPGPGALPELVLLVVPEDLVADEGDELAVRAPGRAPLDVR